MDVTSSTMSDNMDMDYRADEDRKPSARMSSPPPVFQWPHNLPTWQQELKRKDLNIMVAYRLLRIEYPDQSLRQLLIFAWWLDYKRSERR